MFLRKFSSSALVGIVIVLASAATSHAAPAHGGGGFAGHGGGFVGHAPMGPHRAFDGHHFDGHHFDHRFGHRFHGGVVVAPFFWPYYPYVDPGYTAPAPSYWYYCPSYGAYYPSVQSCPEAWVPVPG